MRLFISLTGYLLFFGSLVGQAPSITDMLSSPFPSDLVRSDDGTRVAWVYNTEGVRNVFTASLPELKPLQVTQFALDDGQAITDMSFSPDGSGILFVRGSAANGRGEVPNPTSSPDWPDQEIWITAISDGSLRKVASGHHPSFINGRLIYLRKGDAYTYDLATSEERPLFTIRGSIGELVASPDQNYVAFTSRRGTHSYVGIFDLSSRELHYIDPSVDTDGHIVWAPDSRSLAFIRQKRHRGQLPFFEQPTGLGWSILFHHIAKDSTATVWQSGSGNEGSIFRSIAADQQLMWGAGDELIFPYEGDGWTHLYGVKIKEGTTRLLSPGDGEVQYVAMSMENQAVYFSTNIGDIDRQHIWRTHLGSGITTQVTRGTGVEWAPTPLSRDILICLGSDGIRPARVIRANASGLQDIDPDHLPPHFSDRYFQAPEQVTFSSEGGFEIHGQLFKPKDYRPSQRYPVIFFYHGGSRRQMLLGYHHRGYYHSAFALNQYLASQGYLVLAVNYRSGIGYGLAFREAANYGANGASEYADVLAAADYMRARSDVDVDRMGLWGGSYGGFLTAMGLARHSDIFAVGVDIHGVHDWNVVIKNFAPHYEAAHHPDIQARALQSSPMAYIDTWRSPVLLIHGDDDRNVPFSETVDLVEELRKRNVPFEQVVFPDEVHGFLLHANWVKAYKASVDFLGKHLKTSSQH